MFHPEIIKSRLRRRPFVPLRIMTSSGQAYDIRHPELVIVGVRYLVVGTPSNDAAVRYQTENLLAIMHVTELQDLPVPTA